MSDKHAELFDLAKRMADALRETRDGGPSFDDALDLCCEFDTIDAQHDKEAWDRLHAPSPPIETDAPSEDAMENAARSAGALTANIHSKMSEAMACGMGASDSEIRQIMRTELYDFILPAAQKLDEAVKEADRLRAQLAEERAKHEPQAEASGELAKKWARLITHDLNRACENAGELPNGQMRNIIKQGLIRMLADRPAPTVESLCTHCGNNDGGCNGPGEVPYEVDECALFFEGKPSAPTEATALREAKTQIGELIDCLKKISAEELSVAYQTTDYQRYFRDMSHALGTIGMLARGRLALLRSEPRKG
jgi:hypothetical protein